MASLITRIQPKRTPNQIMSPGSSLLRRVWGKPVDHRNRLIPSPRLHVQLTPQSRNGTDTENDSESFREAPNTSGADASMLQLAQSHNHAEAENDSELFMEALVRRERINNLNRRNGLPTSSEARALGFGAFLDCIILSVIDLSPRYRWSLLMSCCTLLNYEAKNLTAGFDSKLGNTSGSMLSFGEAIVKLLPGMTQSTLFIVCYPLILLLACPLPIILQIIFMLVLIFVPLLHFPELIDKVSNTGVDVSCGPFKLPLIWFTISGTLVLSFICILLILIGMYLIWRYILKGKPGLREPGGIVNLSQILVEN